MQPPWLTTIAEKLGFLGVVSGVRTPVQRGNEVRSSYFRTFAKASSSAAFRQHKHHRWCLDPGQITDYRLGPFINPNMQWWENIEVGGRTLQVIPLASWLVMCHLICEDLVRQDPVSSVIRSIGPTLMLCHLLDGPQVLPRWPNRFASIYADDPGTSVLTLTSLGMALLNRPANYPPPPRTIALWRDSVTGTKQLSLPDSANTILLTLARFNREEFTLDGRSDTGNATVITMPDRLAEMAA